MIQKANKSLQVAQGPSQNLVLKPTFAAVKSAYVYKIQQKSGRKGVCIIPKHMPKYTKSKITTTNE